MRNRQLTLLSQGCHLIDGLLVALLLAIKGDVWILFQAALAPVQTLKNSKQKWLCWLHITTGGSGMLLLMSCIFLWAIGILQIVSYLSSVFLDIVLQHNF